VSASSHVHAEDDVESARLSINPAFGKETILYNDEGSLLRTTRYRDIAGTILDSVETYSYAADGTLETVTTEVYDEAGGSVVQTRVETVGYAVDGSVASETNSA
jgi:hypothetical protein